MELKKHFVTQPDSGPVAGIPSQNRVTGVEVARSSYMTEGAENEPRIYSVRRLLQNLPPDLSPDEKPLAGAPAGSDSVASANSAGEPQTSGILKDAVVSYLENSPREYQIFQAVAKLFEQTDTARSQLNELVLLYDPIETLGQRAAGAFAQLDTFRQQLARLAGAFEPLKAFHLEMARIAETCDAIRPLQDQMAQLSGGFQIHLAALLKVLEPAEEIRMRILQLGEAFEPLATLRERLSELHDVFGRPLSPPSSALGNGSPAESEQGARQGPSGSAVTFFVAKSA